MTSLLRNRNALIAAGAVLLLLILWIIRASRPVQVGDFSLVTPSGWTQEAKNTKRAQGAIYKKKDGSIEFSVVFQLRLDRTASASTTAQTLQAEAAQSFSQTTSIMGVDFRYGPPQPKTISGMPAVEMPVLVTSSSFTVYGRSVDFVKGSRVYSAYATVTMPPTSATSPPAYLATERDEALATITKGLIPPS